MASMLHFSIRSTGYSREKCAERIRTRLWSVQNKISHLEFLAEKKHPDRNVTDRNPRQAVPVMDTLKAVTRNAAYPYGEETETSSLKPGKKANFAILNNNPLKVPKQDLESIQVPATIVDGEVIYRRSS